MGHVARLKDMVMVGSNYPTMSMSPSDSQNTSQRIESATTSHLSQLQSIIEQEWVEQDIYIESQAFTGLCLSHVQVINTDMQVKAKKLELLTHLNNPKEFTGQGVLPVRKIKPGSWYFARLDSDQESAKNIPSFFFGDRSSLQFLSTGDQTAFMHKYLDCVSLINEGIASFEEYPDWAPDEEVTRWLNYSYKYFPKDGTPGKRNSAGERLPGVFTGNRKGKSAYTSGMTAISQYQRVAVQASTTRKNDSKGTGRADYVAALNARVGALAAMLFRFFAPTSLIQREQERAESCNTPRCGSFDNVFSSSMQYNISGIAAELGSQLGDAGGLHVDPNDDPLSLTLMINLSTMFSVPTGPNRFWLAETGHYVEFLPFSWLFFSGKRLHRGFQPLIDPNSSQTASELDLRTMCVCYPNKKIMSREMQLLEQDRDQHGASPWLYGKPVFGTAENQANWMVRELMKDLMGELEKKLLTVGDSIEIRPKDSSSIFQDLVGLFQVCELDGFGGKRLLDLQEWTTDTDAASRVVSRRKEMQGRYDALSLTGSSTWKATLKKIEALGSHKVAEALENALKRKSTGSSRALSQSAVEQGSPEVESM